MSGTDSSKDMQTLLKKLRDQFPKVHTDSANTGRDEAPAPTSIDTDRPLLGHLVMSFLLWESTTTKALTALKRVEAAVVDFNELRHCMPDELTKIFGERYPRVAERALRLRTALNRIYAKEHAVCLESLMTLGKREAREYLDALDGMPRFVSARVALIGLGGHVAPVDSRIQRRLIEAKVVPASSSVDEASVILERKVRAGEMPEAYALLQAWADEANYAPAESHLDGVKTIVKPVVDRIAREKTRLEERKKARRAALAKTKPGANKSAKSSSSKSGKGKRVRD